MECDTNGSLWKNLAACRHVTSRRTSSRSAWSGLVALTLVMVIFINAEPARCEEPTAYEQLEAYGFPRGLLPHLVTGYELNDDGSFVVYLSSACQVDIPSAYPVVYSTKITGHLSYQQLSNLSGVNVKIVWFWFGISTIKVKNENLEFSVGFISSTYPIHPNFDDNPFCLGSSRPDDEALYLHE